MYPGVPPVAQPETEAQRHLARMTVQFNSLVPTRAVRVERAGRHVRYLHPTKGWKFVNMTRFRGAEELLPAQEAARVDAEQKRVYAGEDKE